MLWAANLMRLRSGGQRPEVWKKVAEKEWWSFVEISIDACQETTGDLEKVDKRLAELLQEANQRIDELEKDVLQAKTRADILHDQIVAATTQLNELSDQMSKLPQMEQAIKHLQLSEEGSLSTDIGHDLAASSSGDGPVSDSWALQPVPPLQSVGETWAWAAQSPPAEALILCPVCRNSGTTLPYPCPVDKKYRYHHDWFESTWGRIVGGHQLKDHFSDWDGGITCDFATWTTNLSYTLETNFFRDKGGHTGRCVNDAISKIGLGLQHNTLEVAWHKTNKAKHCALALRCTNTNCWCVCQIRWCTKNTPRDKYRTLHESLFAWLGVELPKDILNVDPKCYVEAAASIRQNMEEIPVDGFQ